MPNADVVWVDVLPSLKQFGPQLQRGVGSAVGAAGTAAGRDFGQSFGKSAQSSVEAASAKMKAALDKTADAAGKVRVAEQRLQELREATNTKASTLAAAEERLATARRNETAANSNLADATKRVADAQDQQTRSAREQADALGQVQQKAKEASGSLGKVKEGFGTLAGVAAGAGLGVFAAFWAGVGQERGSGRLTAQLGLDPMQAVTAGQVAGSLFRDAYGESLEEVNTAVGAVMSSIAGMRTATAPQLEAMTATAMNFASAFEVDISQATVTAGSLITNGFAKDGTEAFDLLTVAYQRVPAAMRDELPDIIQEYGTNFRALGFTGQDAFDLLISASANGKFALDKTGDALKEFTIRSTDMSVTSVAAYQTLGLNAQDMANKILAGGDSARDATAQIANGLLGIQDPATRANTAIALFGTPLEDLSVDQIPAFLEAVGGVGGGLDGVQGAAQRMGDTLNDNVSTRLEAVKRGAISFLQDGVMSLAYGFIDGARSSDGWRGSLESVGAVLSQVWGFVRDTVLPVAGALVDFLSQNMAIVYGVVGAWAAYQAAMLVASAVTFAQTASTYGLSYALTAGGTAAKIYTGVQWALNASIMGFPLVWIVAAFVAVGAGLVLLWKHSETFRDIVTAVWRAVQDGAQWMWERVLRPAFDGIMAGWSGLVTGIQWAWNNVLKPVWNVIQSAADFLYQLLAVTIFVAIWVAWKVMSTWFQFYWNTILKPVWDAVAAVAGWLWNNILSPIFGWIGDRWGWLAGVFSSVYDSKIRPLFDAVSEKVHWLRDRFNDVTGWIGDIWNGLRSKLAKPINFMIGTVWNKGIVPVWNKVADILPGVDRIKEAAPIAEYAVGGRVKDYRAGGRTTGRGTGTSDDVYAKLSHGEHVLTAAEVKAAGGHEAVYRWRRDLLAESNAFAGGGPVWQGLWAIVNKQFPNARLTSAVRPGDPGMHGKGKAVDIGGSRPYPNLQGMNEMLAINKWLASNYGGSTRALIHTPGINLLNGKAHTFDAATRSAHYNHVHWDANEVPNGGSGGFLGWLGDKAGAAFDWLGDMLGKVTSLFTVPARAAVNAIPYDAPPAFLGIPKKIGNWAIDKAEGYFKGKAEDENGRQGSSSFGGSFATTGPVQEQVRAVANQFGWGAGAQWDALVKLVQGESGWNPNAANPSSSARGLFQKMTSLHGPIEGTAGGQAQWGLAYIKNAYGSPANAYAKWLSRSPHWYAQGGAVGQLPVFHQGGTTAGWSGDGLAMLGPDERVLMPQQDDFFRRFVAVTETAQAAGGFGGTVVVRIGNEDFVGYIDSRIEARSDEDARDMRSTRL